MIPNILHLHFFFPSFFYVVFEILSCNYNLQIMPKKLVSLCKNCGERCHDKWCEQCEKNYLKNNFTNWTSKNEKIDNFIQKEQLKFNYAYGHSLFEWIPYNQFYCIKKLNKNNLTIAVWKDGP